MAYDGDVILMGYDGAVMLKFKKSGFQWVHDCVSSIFLKSFVQPA